LWPTRKRADEQEATMSAKVLLVDDEKDFVEVLSERLEARGFKVLQAYNGDDAIKLLNEQDSDVVILDVLMPGKDGLETLGEIKQLKPLTEVIMLTGHATVETAIEGMKLGAYDYLMKPTETEDLVAKIKKAYKLKSEHEERIRQAEIDKIVKARGF
jgi:DNA-binding NtrC family response regulator